MNIEWMLAGFAVGMLVAILWAGSCYCAGWRAANARWLESASRNDVAVLFAGKYYVAVEVDQDGPEILNGCIDFDEFPPDSEDDDSDIDPDSTPDLERDVDGNTRERRRY